MPDEVTWTREVPLLNNYHIVMNALFIILFMGASLGAILILIMGVSEIYAVLRIVTLATGAMIVLAFLVIGVVMISSVEMSFTLTEEGVKTVLGDQESQLNKGVLLLGVLAKPRLVGSSTQAISREKTFTEWTEIQKTVMDSRKKIISLSSERRLLVRLFCTSKVYDEAVNYVERMLPEVDPKYI